MLRRLKKKRWNLDDEFVSFWQVRKRPRWAFGRRHHQGNMAGGNVSCSLVVDPCCSLVIDSFCSLVDPIILKLWSHWSTMIHHPYFIDDLIVQKRQFGWKDWDSQENEAFSMLEESKLHCQFQDHATLCCSCCCASSTRGTGSQQVGTLCSGCIVRTCSAILFGLIRLMEDRKKSG